MRAEARDLVRELTEPGGARFQRLVHDLVIAEGRGCRIAPGRILYDSRVNVGGGRDTLLFSYNEPLGRASRCRSLSVNEAAPPSTGRTANRRDSGASNALAVRIYPLPSSKSTTQHPRTCGSGPRRWIRMSALSQPASSRASLRMGSRSKARSS